jgi:hypothetical protein
MPSTKEFRVSNLPLSVKRRIQDADSRIALLERLLGTWLTYMDLSGAQPVSGDINDHPVLKLIKDSHDALKPAAPTADDATAHIHGNKS